MPVTIEKLVYGGEGLARVSSGQGPAKTLFVPFVLDGEVVEAEPIEEKPGFTRARLQSLVQRSPYRVEPACPYFSHCGGCHLQHADYGRQLAVKEAMVRETLARIGKLELPCALQTHPSPAAWNYRNRTRLQLKMTPTFLLGYFRFRSHQLVPIEQCPISSPLINRALRLLWESGGKSLPGTAREIELFADHSDERCSISLYCRPGIDRCAARESAERIRELLPMAVGVTVFSGGDDRKAGAGDLLAASGSTSLAYQTQHHRYRVSSASFFQVNRYLIDELIALVTEQLSGMVALDVYAGVGLFSAILARTFPKVIAIEASTATCRDLRQNVPAAVEVANATGDRFLTTWSGPRPDLVVVDPPRAGLGKEMVGALSRLAPARIVYVSCDPATMARDLAALRNSGYNIERAHLLDLFPQTYHIESVFHLSR